MFLFAPSLFCLLYSEVTTLKFSRFPAVTAKQICCCCTCRIYITCHPLSAFLSTFFTAIAYIPRRLCIRTVSLDASVFVCTNMLTYAVCQYTYVLVPLITDESSWWDICMHVRVCAFVASCIWVYVFMYITAQVSLHVCLIFCPVCVPMCLCLPKRS